MKLSTLLGRIRALYVEALARAVRDARKKGARAHVEPILRDSKGAVLRDGALDGGTRLDIVVEKKRGMSEVRVDSTKRLEFDPITIPWTQGASVTIEPFTWDCVGIATDLGKTAVAKTVSAWLGRWMDVEDERRPGRDGLHRVVHFASDPAKQGKGAALAIDLGSAPPEALVDLLDALAAVGARRVRIASHPAAA